MIVTGPSLTRATFMSAPNSPVSTRAPRRRSSSTTAPTRGSAPPPAGDRAPLHVGAELAGLDAGAQAAQLVDHGADQGLGDRPGGRVAPRRPPAPGGTPGG